MTRQGTHLYPVCNVFCPSGVTEKAEIIFVQQPRENFNTGVYCECVSLSLSARLVSHANHISLNSIESAIAFTFYWEEKYLEN